MQCQSPLRLKPILPDYPDGLEVPCGKCLLCRMAKRREWALRITHELHNHEKAMFLTLTYDDSCLPENGSLVKSDYQKFIKRVRKKIEPEKLRHFSCGEYGSKTGRPHYHSIIFGLGLSSDDKSVIMDSWDKCDWTVPSISRNSFGLVEPLSIQYVAGYIMKKLLVNKEEYIKLGIEPEFRTMSLGIGREYVDRYAEQIKQMGYVTLRGVKNTLPRYYINRLGIDTALLKDHANELDCEEVEKFTGIYIDSETLYKSAIDEVLTYVKKQKDSRRQRVLNNETKFQLKERSI